MLGFAFWICESDWVKLFQKFASLIYWEHWNIFITEQGFEGRGGVPVARHRKPRHEVESLSPNIETLPASGTTPYVVIPEIRNHIIRNPVIRMHGSSQNSESVFLINGTCSCCRDRSNTC